ncbi:flippase-like domain-containing protein [Patescibacteria group bacterium]|nr:flippase-like domain-containing protein [Patescibacteria group bacterium]MBU1673270.1 flippase-like domain-containing protein [Patescibacteria group bacterium]MBU1964078.1 flippase-like domain-containing protein [Patescibacteria group bacterium]
MKNKTKLFLGLIFGLILILIWFKLIDIEATWEQLSQLKWWVVPILVMLFILRFWARSFRWELVLSPIKKIKILDAFTMNISSFFINYYIPIHIGEVGQSYLLKKKHGVLISKSLPSIFINKLFEIVGFFILIFLLPFIPSDISGFVYYGLVTVLIIFLMVMIMLVWSLFRKDAVVNFLMKLMFMVPAKFKEKVKLFIENFISGVGVIRQIPRHAIGMLMLTLFALVVDAVFIWLVFYAVGFEAPWMPVVIFSLVRQIFYIIPIPPGQIGYAEMIWYMVFVLGFGFASEIVAAASALAHIGSFALLTIFGLLSLSYIGVSLKEVLKKI